VTWTMTVPHEQTAWGVAGQGLYNQLTSGWNIKRKLKCSCPEGVSTLHNVITSIHTHTYTMASEWCDMLLW